MNKQFSKLALALGAVVLSGGAMAQTNASVTDASASATIIAPITLQKNTDLSFGNIVADQLTAGTVVLSAAAEPDRTENVVQLPATKGTVTAAKFTVGGAVGYAFSITLPESATLNKEGGGSLTAEEFTSSKPGEAGTISGTAENNVFYVGATLNVGAAQAAGNYTGTFAVSVAYD